MRNEKNWHQSFSLALQGLFPACVWSVRQCEHSSRLRQLSAWSTASGWRSNVDQMVWVACGNAAFLGGNWKSILVIAKDNSSFFSVLVYQISDLKMSSQKDECDFMWKTTLVWLYVPFYIYKHMKCISTDFIMTNRSCAINTRCFTSE